MIRIAWTNVGIEWGEENYIYLWNWLRPEHRFVGLAGCWYDGPHYSIGFWYFHITWSFPFPKFWR